VKEITVNSPSLSSSRGWLFTNFGMTKRAPLIVI
jgi:hypothetical protein